LELRPKNQFPTASSLQYGPGADHFEIEFCSSGPFPDQKAWTDLFGAQNGRIHLQLRRTISWQQSCKLGFLPGMYI